MYDSIPYTSFFWSFGTTSFRMKEFNYAIERQLQLLSEFWEKPENKNVAWDKSFSDENSDTSVDIYEIKDRYYDYLVEEGFIVGNDRVKYKAAREKTASLAALGLVNANRRLTEVGRRILEISNSRDYSSDNYMLVARDSFVYFKQLLKLSRTVNNKVVRPYIILMYLLNELEYLTYDEFTYLLPLCVDEESTELIVNKIKNLRDGKGSIDEIIVNAFMQMENYKKAYDLLINNSIDEDLIVTIGMNRKSGANGKKQYDSGYFRLYEILYEVCVNKKKDKLIDVYNCTKIISLTTALRGYLFTTQSVNLMRYNPEQAMSNAKIYQSEDESDFKKNFFEMLHLAKAKATLRDYFDINRRIVKLSDLVLFKDNKVQLDVIPGIVIGHAADDLYKQAFEDNKFLEVEVDLSNICGELLVSEDVIIKDVKSLFGVEVKTMDEVKKIVENNRIELFDKLIDTKFTNDVLADLLDKFKTRDDNSIQRIVTDSADVPTIFEYILGIIWYKVSERKGNVLEFMNLDFDADLLPKHHAGGGESDIVYHYDKTGEFPEHSVLIEATLMNASAQKLNEDEPATRHLGEYRLDTGLDDSYCVFCAPTIPINLVSSFRNKVSYEYFNKDGSDSITDIKLIPVETDEMKYIIENNIYYRDLYRVFDNAFRSTEPVKNWYKKCIIEELKAIS